MTLSCGVVEVDHPWNVEHRAFAPLVPKGAVRWVRTDDADHGHRCRQLPERCGQSDAQLHLAAAEVVRERRIAEYNAAAVRLVVEQLRRRPSAAPVDTAVAAVCVNVPTPSAEFGLTEKSAWPVIVIMSPFRAVPKFALSISSMYVCAAAWKGRAGTRLRKTRRSVHS